MKVPKFENLYDGFSMSGKKKKRKKNMSEKTPQLLRRAHTSHRTKKSWESST